MRYPGYGQELREDHDDELFIVTTAPLDVQATTQVTMVCPRMVPLLGACPSYFPTVPRDRQHCLHDRFPITIRWQTAANEGIAEPVQMGSRDTGMFWFFSPKNWEVMIKVLDGCSVNGHWWVFLAAMTNQGYEVRVGDSASLKWKTYTNHLGTRSPAFTDTTAFSCP